MFKELEREDDWLTDAWYDLTIHRLKYRSWFDGERVWQVWIRT